MTAALERTGGVEPGPGRGDRGAPSSLIGCALLGCALLLLSGCRAGGGGPPPAHLLLVTVDTLRADAVGFAGDDAAVTQNLDRLASGGRVFTGAHAHAVTTLPSHASILTGLLPPEHGVRKNGGYRLAERHPTLATLLAEAGFATAAFVGAFPLAARFGLDRGFELYDDELPGGLAGSLLHYPERRGDEVVSRAAAWWRSQAGRRRFLWVHLFDPHAPYAPPEPFASRFPERPYLGEVAAVDAFLEPLLAPILAGEEEPTLVVFTSDHGEALGDHGEETHGLFAYEATLAVPLVLWGGPVEPGVDGRAARHVDLLPTVLEALGLPAPAGLPGRSLLAPPPESTVTYFESLSTHLELGWAPLRGVLHDGLKLIDLPLPELYDLRVDPGERRNLFAERPAVARSLARLLPAEAEWPPPAAPVPADEAAPLRALGYLGGGAPGRRSFTADDDPKRLVELDREIARMGRLGAAGELERAIAIGRELLARRPAMAAVALQVAAWQIQDGNLEAATDTLVEARRHGAAGRELDRQLGLTLIGLGRAEEALGVLAPLAAEGDDVEARNHLALALARLGRLAEAEGELRGALALDPRFARTHENLSYVALLGERWAEAAEHAERALARDDRLADAWNNLGLARYRQGQAAEAADAWRSYLELVPGDLVARFHLGVVELEAGQRAAGRASLERFLAAAPPELDAQRRQARALLAEIERRPSQ